MTKNLLIASLAAIASAIVVGIVHIAIMPWLVTGNAYKTGTSVDSVDELRLQAPVNQIAFSAGPYTAEMDVGDIGMTGPMADQIYAQGWLDISEQPMIFEVPDFGDRYFVIPIIDRWNRVNGYIGTRATGSQGGRYAVVRDGWQGEIPAGIETITGMTDQVNFLFRVFIAGEDDFAAADELRRQTKLYPLSELAEQRTSTAAEDFEAQVDEYIKVFPYQDSFEYAMRYTNGDAAKLNTWIIGAEPSLVKAGEDRIVRMNNDTFYKMAVVHLSDGPVTLSATVPDRSRFVSFQLMDDRNVNYANVMFPNGLYTLFHGEQPADLEGTPIEVPSETSFVIVRVEVMDTEDREDVAAAEAVFRTIEIDGPAPSEFPSVDLVSKFDANVIEEGNRRLDEAFKTIPFRLTVVGPGKEPGTDVPYLNHSAGTKGGWGGPGTEHSSYESINFDNNGAPLVGANGTYSVTTEEPPVDAFWSITVYDTDRGGFLHPNKYDRYHINNTTAVNRQVGTYSARRRRHRNVRVQAVM